MKIYEKSFQALLSSAPRSRVLARLAQIGELARRLNDLQRAALQRLQLRFSRKHCLITDEMSMLGQRSLAWVDKRLRQATGKLHEPLGEIFVVLLGDFAQLPPV